MSFWFKDKLPKCNSDTCHFFFDPRGTLNLDYLPSQCNVTTLFEPELVSTILCSVKVIAITFHNCCLFLSRKCHSDLSYLFHLEYYHLNPSLFISWLFIWQSLLNIILLSSNAPISILLPIIFFHWVIYFFKTLSKHLFPTTLSKLLYEIVRFI